MDDREGFEIVEHTADVGFKAWGPTLPSLFHQATLALLEINGARGEGNGESHAIAVTADDHAALLVDWLDEVLYAQEARDMVVAGIRVEDVRPGSASGYVTLVPYDGDIEGTAVKAITYHQLSVAETDGMWHASVFVDI